MPSFHLVLVDLGIILGMYLGFKWLLATLELAWDLWDTLCAWACAQPRTAATVAGLLFIVALFFLLR